ncbi:MAG: hypothetical protein IPN93_04790 [Bacteroidetes bacterium]|nr:hypothetical protein [Bacteroidota bacterium]
MVIKPFFYKEKFDKKEAKDFDRYNSSLAKKMAIKPLTFRYYNCKDIQEVYKLLGIDYDISINELLKDFIQSNQYFSPLDALKGDEYLKHPILIKYPIAAVLVRKVET